MTEDCGCTFTAGYRAPFPEDVRLTSIYSKGDGMVRWSLCVVLYADNVEVTGSHVGLAWNRKAYRRSPRRCASPSSRAGLRSRRSGESPVQHVS